MKNIRTEKIVTVSIILVVSLLITQLIGEVIVRIIAPQPLNPSLYQFDNYFGFSLGSNFSGRSKNFDYDVNFFTNEYGLRSDNTGSNNNMDHNILVVGDSYSFGTGVEFQESYPVLLLSKLNELGLINENDLLNTGIPAWGTSQELLMFEKILKTNEPGLVIWQICENDFDNNIQYGLHKIIGDSLHYFNPKPSTRDKIRRYTRFIPFYDYLVENSHLINLYRRSLILLIRGGLSMQIDENLDKEKFNFNNHDERWLLMKKILDKVIHKIEIQDIEFLPIFIPSGGNKIQRTGHNPLVDLMFSYFNQQSIKFINFNYLGFDKSLRFSSDGHWKPLAHKIAADSLTNYIKTLNIFLK